MFSGKEEDWAAFSEQFEARLHVLNLGDCLEDKLDVPEEKEGESAEETDARTKAEVERKRQRFMIWNELVQCLDKVSINFIRLKKPDGVEAWRALTGKHKSTDRPRIQTLLAQLTGLKMGQHEQVVQYLTRAEIIRLDLEEAGEKTTEQMFIAMVLKGLPASFESVSTVLNFGPKKGYEEMKQDLINFSNSRCSGSDVASTAFHSSGNRRQVVCFKCNEPGHISRDCRRKDPRKCFRCNQPGHISRNCQRKHAGSGTTTQRGHSSTGSSDVASSDKRSFFAFGSYGKCSDAVGVELLVDSGCNGFMLKDRALFKQLDLSATDEVGNANGSRSAVKGKGTAEFKTLDSEGNQCAVELKQAFWVPSYTRNLISVKKLAMQGATVSFGKQAHIRTSDGTLIPLVCTSDDLYTLIVYPSKCNLGPKALDRQLPGIAFGNDSHRSGSYWVAASSRSMEQWHLALGHNNYQDVARLPQLVEGMAINRSQPHGHCDSCATEKAKRAPVKKTCSTRAETQLDIVHTDVLGPIQQTSHEGYRYAIGFIDSFSRYAVVYPMRSREEVPEKLEQFFADVGTPKTLVSDGALEYKSKLFSDLCRKNGVRQEFSAPYTPQENGKIERIWGTVTGMSRCMMETAGVSKMMWPYALATAFYLKNRTFHSAHGKTPYEMFFGVKPSVRNLQPFGCQAFVFSETGKKLDSKAKRGIMLGYSSRSNCYIVCTDDVTDELGPSKMWLSRNVTFNPDSFPLVSMNRPMDVYFDDGQDDRLITVTGTQKVGKETDVTVQRSTQEGSDSSPEEETTTDEAVTGTQSNIDIEEETVDEVPPTAVPQMTSSGRAIRTPEWQQDFITGDELENLALHSDAMGGAGIPVSASQALADPNWKAAMKREYDSLMTNNVWTLVPRPEGRQPITGKWHFALKLDSQGHVTKYKARFVARGFTQSPGLDYHETYSPTVKLSTLRTVLACGIQKGARFKQMDIKTAYLNAPLDEEILLEQPEGFRQGTEDVVCKLQKSLYGLKQSGRNWFECLSKLLQEAGLSSSEHDRCLWTTQRDGHWGWVLVWVDDILYGSTSVNFSAWFESQIEAKFVIGDCSDLTWFLGIAFDVGDNHMTLNHTSYVKTLLEKYQMQDCNKTATPLAEKCELTKDDSPDAGSDEQIEMQAYDYRGLVGSISYLAQTTRPDLSFASHLLSKFLNNPGKTHWKAAKHVLRYLRGTSDVGLTYSKTNVTGLTGFTDADYASCKDDRKSVTGFCFNLGSAAVSWLSKKQTCVATSTTEAEVFALSEATKEALHLLSILDEIGQTTGAKILCDSQSCLALVTKDDNSQRAKHFATRLAFIKDTVRNKSNRIELTFVPSAQNQADIFTKGLGKTKTAQHLEGLSAMRGCQNRRPRPSKADDQ